MVLYKEKYAVQRKPIKLWIDNRPDKNPVELISEMAVHTGCPIIVVCYFLGELVGFTPELQSKIESLKKFYGVTEVL